MVNYLRIMRIRRSKAKVEYYHQSSLTFSWNIRYDHYISLKMLNSEKLLESLIDQIKVTDTFDSLLFKWNSEQKCFQLKSKTKQSVYKARLFISVLYAFFVFTQIFWTWNNISIFIKLHSMFLFSGLLMFIYTHCVFCSKAELIVSYLNGMLIFENQLKGKYYNLNKP